MRNPAQMLFLFTTAILAYLVLPPFFFILHTSLVTDRGLQAGSFTIQHFLNIVDSLGDVKTLLSNSLIYTVSSSAVALVYGTSLAWLAERGLDWEMSFADTGPGINPQQTEKIFEPFQSNFEGGTGLGLAIVYQIVQAHEGKVWARSAVGKGTSFVVRLRRMEHSHDQGAAGGTSASASASVSSGAALAAAGGTSG